MVRLWFLPIAVCLALLILLFQAHAAPGHHHKGGAFCEKVRKVVADIGEQAAHDLAVTMGATPEQIRRGERCLTGRKS